MELKIENGILLDVNQVDTDFVVVPDGVIEIGEKAFSYCPIKKILLPEGLIKIGKEAFIHCTGLEEINIPLSVKTIGQWAFYDTAFGNNLKKWEDNGLYIDNCLISAYNVARHEAEEADEYEYDYDDEFINEDAEFTFSVKKNTRLIADNAFRSFEGVTEIFIPSSVAEISGNTFCDCNSLKSIHVACFNEHFASENGILFDKDKTTLIKYPSKKEENIHYQIPESVTRIESNSFYGCCFESVHIPESVISIGEGAFAHCYNLTEVNLPTNLEVISDRLFECCALNEIVIPENVYYIGNNAFCGCHISSIVIPASVSYIGVHAFSRCLKLVKVRLPDGIEELNNGIFSGCPELSDINFPADLKIIGQYAFGACRNLRFVSISEKVEHIGVNSFDGCNFNCSLVVSNDNKWYRCDEYGGLIYNNSELIRVFNPDIKEYVVAENIEYIHFNAFSECAGLRLIVVSGELRVLNEWIKFVDRLPEKYIESGRFAGMYPDGIREPGFDGGIYFEKNDIMALPDAQWRDYAVIGFVTMVSRGVIPDEAIYDKYLKYIRRRKKHLYALIASCSPLLEFMINENVIPSADYETVLRYAAKCPDRSIIPLMNKLK